MARGDFSPAASAQSRGAKPAFLPYHRPPSPPLPANTLILPSTASSLDVPLHFSTRKRRFFALSSNATSAALLEALHHIGEEGAAVEKPQRPAHAEIRQPLSSSYASTASQTSSEEWQSDYDRHSRLESTSESQRSRRVQSPTPQSPTRTAPAAATTQRRPRTGESRSPNASAPSPPRRAVNSAQSRTASPPFAARPSSPAVRHGADQRPQTPFRPTRPVTAENAQPKTTPPAGQSPQPVPIHRSSSPQRERRSPSPSRRVRVDTGKLKVADLSSSAGAESRRRPASAVVDSHHRAQVHHAAQRKRQEQGRTDDVYYAAMMRRQWERRVRMDFLQGELERHRAEQRLQTEGRVSRDLNDALAGLQQRPVFADFGGNNTRPAGQAHLMTSFNITPDVSGHFTPAALRCAMRR